MSTTTEPEQETKTEKPRGKCTGTGCGFEYQLGTARSGEHKGQLVIRKHNSRIGPGLCDGAQKPPAGAAPETVTAQEFADPAPVAEQRESVPPVFYANFDGMGECGHPLQEGDLIQADGEGGWLCSDCIIEPEGNWSIQPQPARHEHRYALMDDGNGHSGSFCTVCGDHEPEGTAPQAQPPTQQQIRNAESVIGSGAPDEVQSAALSVIDSAVDAGVHPAMLNVPGAPVETVTDIPHGHDLTDSTGATWRHGGPLADCTVQNCIEYRNRLTPPDTTRQPEHACHHGVFMDQRNCPEHGVFTPTEFLGELTRAVGDPGTVAGQLNGVPVSHSHYDHDARELHQGTKEQCARCAYGVTPPALPADVADPTAPGTVTVPQFADPAAPPQELPPVSGQPEPDRDRWGRYLLTTGNMAKPSGHTRATTFAKLGSSTYALGEWNERMLIVGLTQRRDLLAMAHGMDVKANRNELNSIADQAQEHAGNKVAANIGTAYHTFTERLDAGLITLDQVPEEWRARCGQYLEELARYGLRTRPEWIERTTAVRADQVSAPVPVAGTLDRIFELPDGSLVIGDLKTSSNIEYSWVEIAVQLAIYAHGVNTHGLFDWRTKTWQRLDRPVRTDIAIVMHLPADGDGCALYTVDLPKGWEYAQVSGRVQSRQKDKSIATPVHDVLREVPREQRPVVAPAPQLNQIVSAPAVQALETAAAATTPPSAHLAYAFKLVSETTDPAALGTLYEYAQTSGQFSPEELDQVRSACAGQWAVLSG